MNRRDFLTITGAAAAGALALPRIGRAGGPAGKKNLIVVLASGGWDPTHVLDPKTDPAQCDIPAGSIQLYGNLPIFVDGTSRPSVTAFFDAWAPVCAAVNGIAINSIAHPECRQRILTGTRSEGSPDVGAIAAFETGWDLPAPYLVLGNSAYTGDLASGTTRVGSFNQITALLDPVAAAAGPYPVPPFVPAALDAADVRTYVQSRADRVRLARATQGANQKRIADYLDSLGRGDLLRANKAAFGAGTQTRTLPQQCTLAVQMIQSGISCAVHIDSGEQWDTHTDNTDQNVAHDDLYAGLKGLADQLDAAPGKQAGNTLLDETVVVVLSELGRTPLLNAANGKDHWPTTSALIFGGGVAGGRVFGATTAGLDPQKIDYLTGLVSAGGKTLETASLVAGIVTLVGGDPSGFFPGVEVFDAFVA